MYFAVCFDLGESCSIRYGTGSISGHFSQDNVQVGDLVVKDQVNSCLATGFSTYHNMTLSGFPIDDNSTSIFQVFIEATREPSITFIIAKFDGILGLGFQEISVGNATPVW